MYSANVSERVEEREGQLFAYEFKWAKKQVKAPVAWEKAYPEAQFQVVHPENFRAFIFPPIGS